MRSRFRLVLGLIAVAFAAVAARLAHLQVWRHPELSAKAASQSLGWIREVPRRAPILDRHGAVLAESVRTASCYADPTLVTRPRETARRLSRALAMPAGEIERRIRRAPGAFVWLRRGIPLERAQAVEEQDLEGIGLLWEYRRFHPNGDLAAPVLGLVGEDGQGLSGLEYAFNESLIEKRPPRRSLRDGRGRRLSLTTAEDRPVEGALRLTLDRTLQFIAERELSDGLRRSGSKRGVAVVQDVRTGEILALASAPHFSFDGKGRPAPGDLAIPAAQWAFEPGSTFKVVTAAAALEEGVVTPEERFDCEAGRWRVAGLTINDHEPQKRITFAQAMEVSSNIGLAKVGLRVGKERLYDYVRAFGFGARTGFDLPGESAGLLRPPAQWSGVSLPVISFGQEVGVTAIQLVSAYSAIANGGRVLEPRLCVEASWPDGATARWPLPAEVRRVVSPETARTLAGIMEGVVTRGTGRHAEVPGWSVAGKTGTAQKIDPKTRTYARDRYVASFCGFVPARQPRLAIAVILDEPKGISWGGYNAGPVFREIAWQALARLGVPPDQPRYAGTDKDPRT